MSNSMSAALKSLIPEIVITKAPPVPPKKPQRPKQYINGYEVHWVPQEGENKPIPVLKNQRFYIQFPTKKEDIDFPAGAVRATYNKEKRQVEYYRAGSDTPIKVIHDQKHEPLPLPKYFSQLESVEEIFDINFETGEINSFTKIDVMTEAVHWKLRLQEFEKNQANSGVSKFVIERKLNKYVKSLVALRGVSIEELNEPVPQSVVAAIEYIRKQSQIRSN